MTTPEPASTCHNCGKPIPATGFCPNCGAPPPPLPEITNEPNPERIVNALLITNSRGGDIAIGIVLGVVFPPLLTVTLTALLDAIRNSVAFTTVILALFIPLVIGIPFGVAFALKRKRHVAGNAMQKALFGWLILIGLILLGLLVMCATGNFKI